MKPYKNYMCYPKNQTKFLQYFLTMFWNEKAQEIYISLIRTNIETTENENIAGTLIKYTDNIEPSLKQARRDFARFKIKLQRLIDKPTEKTLI